MDKHAEKKLFTPVQVGPLTLKHRVVMPPMSRLRAQPGTGIPSDLQLEYYTQRASNGGLIITEATAIAPSARGYYHAPGLYTDEQIAGWKRITDAVHAKGAYFFTQLWHAGRTTHISITGSEPVTASVDPAYWADTSITVDTPDGFEPTSPHRALETAEIATILEQYRSAAQNAKAAGFDGVELMAANGHLVDQFLQDNTNKRTDQYGGSIENRTRFLAEVVQTLAGVWGADRVGVRLAPSGTFNGMGDSDPRALFRHVAERLNDFGLAYLHLIEPRVKGGETIAEAQAPVAAQELSKIFRGPVIAVGGFNPETAKASVANGDASLIAFGRHFIANPDLPKRIELGLPLNPYDRSTFYGLHRSWLHRLSVLRGHGARSVSRGLRYPQPPCRMHPGRALSLSGGGVRNVKRLPTLTLDMEINQSLRTPIGFRGPRRITLQRSLPGNGLKIVIRGEDKEEAA